MRRQDDQQDLATGVAAAKPAIDETPKPTARDVDRDKLARLLPKMTGAKIRNVALGAASLPASKHRRTSITLR